MEFACRTTFWTSLPNEFFTKQIPPQNPIMIITKVSLETPPQKTSKHMSSPLQSFLSDLLGKESSAAVTIIVDNAKLASGEEDECTSTYSILSSKLPNSFQRALCENEQENGNCRWATSDRFPNAGLMIPRRQLSRDSLVDYMNGTDEHTPLWKKPSNPYNHSSLSTQNESWSSLQHLCRMVTGPAA